ncbi:hypothetical protein B8W90_14090, partial [Staphylococcus hominis]
STAVRPDAWNSRAEPGVTSIGCGSPQGAWRVMGVSCGQACVSPVPQWFRMHGDYLSMRAAGFPHGAWKGMG